MSSTPARSSSIVCEAMAMAAPFETARSFLRFICLLAVAGAAFPLPLAAQKAMIRPPQNGEVRALVIGIDAYQFVPPLRGAAADAHDIEQTLRNQGVKDVTALYDAAADRATVLRCRLPATASRSPSTSRGHSRTASITSSCWRVSIQRPRRARSSASSALNSTT
jgi:hypothetical protein